jgi:hypothetical protein
MRVTVRIPSSVDLFFELRQSDQTSLEEGFVEEGGNQHFFFAHVFALKRPEIDLQENILYLQSLSFCKQRLSSYND